MLIQWFTDVRCAWDSGDRWSILIVCPATNRAQAIATASLGITMVKQVAQSEAECQTRVKIHAVSTAEYNTVSTIQLIQLYRASFSDHSFSIRSGKIA